MIDTLFMNFALLDTEAGRLHAGYQVLVQGNVIAKVAKGKIRAPGAKVVDLKGRTLMPGLVDCHIHICMPPTGMVGPSPILPSLLTARSSDRLREMLMRGFTTVRDGCGADMGHKQAVEQGIFVGPRLFVSGRSITQTGGHGDMRARSDLQGLCSCAAIANHLGRVADGVTEVRRAVREELRLGADQIKVMAGGGVGSAADPIDQLQYSMEELKACVDETTRSHTYCMAHAYTDAAIRRCVEAGIRSVEHGNFLEPATAKMMAKAGTYLVPTLVAYHSIARFGPQMPAWTPELLAKGAQVLAVGTRSLEVAKKAGVKIAFGTDLGWMHPEIQCEEFLIRNEVMSPAEILHSATIVGSEVVRLKGKIGVVKPGAFADLLVVDGNPLKDLTLFQEQGKHLAAIMKDGAFVKNRLGR